QESFFSKSFRLHIAPLGCFSDEEMDTIVATVEKHGAANENAWKSVIYDEFFKPREWHAAEFEKCNASDVSDAIAGDKEALRKRTYDNLMQHIQLYAKNLESVLSAKNSRCQYDIVYDTENEQRAKEALAKDPEAIPPFFPGDRTMIKVKIPGFE
ncbi:MAG: hypothetical protein LBC10_01705, partial [Deltaproteobacteria bacterium]|nr:hypothetical protein [Deltaproteobacteria bacterium]